MVIESSNEALKRKQAHRRKVVAKRKKKLRERLEKKREPDIKEFLKATEGI